MVSTRKAHTPRRRASSPTRRRNAVASPRGTLFLDRMAKAHAYLEGRDYVTGGDVQAIFHDVCAHRVILNQKSRLSGGTVTPVLNELLETVEVPDRRQA